MSRITRKPDFGVSDQVLHKPGCTATEVGYRLEISDLGSRGIVLSVAKTKVLISNREANLRLCFHICQKPVFPWRCLNGFFLLSFRYFFVLNQIFVYVAF